MRLSDICEINPKADPINDHTMVSFVSMPDVSDSGKIKTTTARPFGEVKKGFTSFREGDVLFAKITPCMENGKGALAIGLINGFGCGSTEFHVLRPKPNAVDGKWLYYLTAWPAFRADAERHMTGSAGQKRVPKSFLEKYAIVVPKLFVQKEQADQFDRIKRAIDYRKKQISLLDDLIKARFVEMFGDMLINPKGFPEQRLDALADIVSGITKGWKAKTDELYEVPYMAVSNVKDGYIDWTTVKTIMATTEEINQYRLMPNDVLMTEGGDPDKLGRGAIIHEPPKDCIHQNHIFRVRLNQDTLLPVYLAQYLQQQKAKRYFLGCAKQTTGIASINMRQLSALPVLLPSMNEQKEYADFVAQIDKSKFAIQQSLNETQKLFDSLMQQYFG